MNTPLPTNKREARQWVRDHFAWYIANADLGLDRCDTNDLIAEVWDDECQKIAKRVRGD